MRAAKVPEREIERVSDHNVRESNFEQARHWNAPVRCVAFRRRHPGGHRVMLSGSLSRLDLDQHFLVTAERRFWRCAQTGEKPTPYGVEPPRPRIEAVRIVDMSESNSWAEFAGLFCATRSAFLDHERAKAELKALMPEDAREAIGHGVRAKRSKSGAISFDQIVKEDSHAAI